MSFILPQLASLIICCRQGMDGHLWKAPPNSPFLCLLSTPVTAGILQAMGVPRLLDVEPLEDSGNSPRQNSTTSRKQQHGSDVGQAPVPSTASSSIRPGLRGGRGAAAAGARVAATAAWPLGSDELLMGDPFEGCEDIVEESLAEWCGDFAAREAGGVVQDAGKALLWDRSRALLCDSSRYSSTPGGGSISRRSGRCDSLGTGSTASHSEGLELDRSASTFSFWAGSVCSTPSGRPTGDDGFTECPKVPPLQLPRHSTLSFDKLDAVGALAGLSTGRPEEAFPPQTVALPFSTLTFSSSKPSRHTALGREPGFTDPKLTPRQFINSLTPRDPVRLRSWRPTPGTPSPGVPRPVLPKFGVPLPPPVLPKPGEEKPSLDNAQGGHILQSSLAPVSCSLRPE